MFHLTELPEGKEYPKNVFSLYLININGTQTIRLALKIHGIGCALLILLDLPLSDQ